MFYSCQDYNYKVFYFSVILRRITNMTLFERTKETAKIRGLSLYSLEKQSGLSENALYSWRKSSPKSENLQKVADVLHVSTDYLLGRTDEMNPTVSNGKNENHPQLRRIARRSDVLDAANDMTELNEEEVDSIGKMITLLLNKKKNDGL